MPLTTRNRPPRFEWEELRAVGNKEALYPLRLVDGAEIAEEGEGLLE